MCEVTKKQSKEPKAAITILQLIGMSNVLETQIEDLGIEKMLRRVAQ